MALAGWDFSVHKSLFPTGGAGGDRRTSHAETSGSKAEPLFIGSAKLLVLGNYKIARNGETGKEGEKGGEKREKEDRKKSISHLHLLSIIES